MRKKVSQKLQNVRCHLQCQEFCADCPLGQHAVRGATKEKSRKLDELKAKRKAKDEKKRVHPFPLFFPPNCVLMDTDEDIFPQA